MDIMAWFIPFLLFLGITTPPICGIYIADYLVNRRKGYDEASLEMDSAIKPMTFVAWGAASFVGFCTVNGWFTLTGIPSVDSILVAFVGYFLFSILSPYGDLCSTAPVRWPPWAYRNSNLG